MRTIKTEEKVAFGPSTLLPPEKSVLGPAGHPNVAALAAIITSNAKLLAEVAYADKTDNTGRFRQMIDKCIQLADKKNQNKNPVEMHS